MHVRLLSLLLIVSLASVTAEAQKPPAPNALELGSDPSLAELMPTADGFASQRTGRALTLTGLDKVVRPASPEAMAREFLSGHENVLGLREVDMELTRVREGLAGTTVRFQQTVNGVPVWGTDTAVSLDLQNRVQAVFNGARDVGSVVTDPVVPAEAARQSAHTYLGVEGDLHFDETALVVWPGDEATRLAWQIQVHAAQPTGEWEAIVDAETGEFLRVADRTLYHGTHDPTSPDRVSPPHPMLFRTDGTGFIFDPDPLTRAGVSYGTAGYVDGGDANTPQLEAARVQVTLRDVTLVGSTYELSGPWAEMVDWEAPFKGTFGQSTPDWSFTRDNDAFEVATVYWHIDNYMRYVNETLGVPAVPQAYTSGVRFDAHGVNGSDNSFFTSGTDRLSFGEGCVDDAEDADVVIHELGHGLHDWLSGISQVDGLSEGLADYIAASYTRGLALLSPSDPSYNWVFKWDGHNPCWGGRTAGLTGGFPSGFLPHGRGQHWASSLMRVWNVIGQQRTDTAVFEGIAMTNRTSGQPQSAQAVLQAAANLGYSQAEIQTFFDSFVQQGYPNLTMPVANEPEGANVLNEAIEVSTPRPNPFFGTTELDVRVERSQHVTVEVFDALGRQVAVLLDEPLVAGRRYPMTVDGQNLDAGVYLVRARGETIETTRRILLTR
ncbi:MAG: T9SS type A sorting domain-containing protein [Bacteroidota bacterium]